MEIPKARRNSSSKVVNIAIILLGIIAGYFYYTQVGKNDSSFPAPNIPTADNLNKFRDAKTFDLIIFNDPSFKILKTIGDVPVQPGPTGRTDIFAPFWTSHLFLVASFQLNWLEPRS